MDTYKPFAKLGQLVKLLMEDEPESPQLHSLARDGNAVQLAELIENGCDVNVEDDEGLTALYIATGNSHGKIVELLLQNGACVNTKYNPLHVVRDLKCAQLLFQATGDVFGRDEFGNSVLHKVINSGDADLVDFYLSIGADVHCVNNKGETPLHTVCSSYTCQPQNERIIKRLIEMGADVNSKDFQKKSPLHVALLNYDSNKYETINILVKAGASLTDLDLQGSNPIHYFIEKSRACTDEDEAVYMRFINLLISDDTAANSINSVGQTILHLCMAEAPLHVLRYLVNKGCSVNVLDGQKRSLLHYIAERENLGVLYYLLEKGLDINGGDVWGQTVLLLAVEKNNTLFVKALVESGADVNHKDIIGRQAVHIAAKNGLDLICDFLLKQGADVNALDKYQSTPLHLAAWNNEASVADILIKRKHCDVLLRDANKETAKECAEFRSSFDFLSVLSENDEDDHPTQQQGKMSKYGNNMVKIEALRGILDSTEALRKPGDIDDYLRCLISKPTIGTVCKDPEALEIRRVVNRFAAHIAKCISESHPKMRCTLFPAGSSAEGTKVQYPDEFDYIVCLDEFSKHIYPEFEKEDVKESHELISNKKAEEKNKAVLEEGVDYKIARASVSDYTFIFLNEQSHFLYSEYTDVDAKIIPNYTMFQIFTQLVSNVVCGEHFSTDDRLMVKDVTKDPKLSLLWRGCRYKSLVIDVDFVPAFRLPSWPNKSRVLSKVLRPDLLHLPCFAVPKMTSQQDCNLWRCSLSLVENALMRRCLPRIRNSYIVAKSLINSKICPLVSFGDDDAVKMQYRSEHDSLSSDEEFELYEHVEGVLTSYILKMAFLYSIEEKANKDSVEAVFGERVDIKDESEQTSLYSPVFEDLYAGVCKESDSEIVKDIFKRCDAWLSNHFVPSFFNPHHNVLSSRMLGGEDVKAQYFIKYIRKLLSGHDDI